MKGEISNIEKIYNKVIEEGKYLNDKLKQVNDKLGNLGKGFLSFFQTVEGEEGQLIQEYVDFKDLNRVKTECYYCTKHGKVKGIMCVKDKIIMYDPIQCKENEFLKKFDLNSKFQVCIDLKDVASC